MPISDEQVCSFYEPHRSYFVNLKYTSKGKGRNPEKIYLLSRVSYSPYLKIEIGVKRKCVESLIGLTHSTGAAKCEKLIMEQLCAGCLEQRTREPPQL